MLSQIQDGKERLISVCGRKTTKYEQNYPSIKGEMAAIIYALRKWEHLLRFREFILITDSAALRHLHSLKAARGIWWRWLQEVTSYQFEITHRAGKTITHADGLSRSSHLPKPDQKEEEEQGEYIENVTEELELNMENLRREQRDDPHLKYVFKWIRTQKPDKKDIKHLEPEVKQYWNAFEGMEIRDQLMYMKYQANQNIGQQTPRVVIPERLRSQAFYYVHNHPSAGHFGRDGTKARAARKFWWPSMGSQIAAQVDKCSTCLAKQRSTNVRGSVHVPVNVQMLPGEKLSIDLVGPMPTSMDNKKYILTMQDNFSRYVNATPIQNKEAATVAEALMKTWIGPFGCPIQIHSDQGREFVNSLWTELCSRLEIRKTTTPPYNPNSNSVERWHRTLNAILRTHLDREDPGWPRVLPMAVLAYNTKVNSTTGVTPQLAWTGREEK